MENVNPGIVMIIAVNVLCWVVGWFALRSDTPATK